MNIAATENHQGLPADYIQNILDNWPAAKLLRENLDALKKSNLTLSQKINDTPTPDHVEFVIARDGSPSFRLIENQKKIWLGYSSVPRIFAECHCQHVELGSDNLAGNGIGHAADAKLLLQMMDIHQCLFILEPNLLNIKLAFQLQDLSEEISQGRLVLITDPEPQNELREFYCQYPGYNLVGQAISRPHLTQPENRRFAETVTAAMESIAAGSIQTINRIAQKFHELTTPDFPNRIRSITNSPPYSKLCVINCTNTNHPADVVTSRDCLAGLKSLDVFIDHLFFDRPDKVSQLSQLQRVEQNQPQIILLVDMLRGDLGHPLPENTICATLLRQSPANLFAEIALTKIGKFDFIFPCRDDQREKLSDNGFAPEKLHTLPLAVNPDIFHPLSAEQNDLQKYKGQISFISHRSSIDPEKYNIHLPTHQKLWKSVQTEITQRIDEYQFDNAGKFLNRAERNGVELKEPDLRHHFTELIANYLAPSVVKDIHCREIMKAGLHLNVWSWSPAFTEISSKATEGWLESPAASAVRGMVGYGSALNKIFNTAPLTVFIDTTGLVEQALLESLAAGSLPLLRRHPNHRTANGIAAYLEIDKEIVTFATPAELIEKARYYLAHNEEREILVQTAREKILSCHTMQNRMAEMINFIREKI